MQTTRLRARQPGDRLGSGVKAPDRPAYARNPPRPAELPQNAPLRKRFCIRSARLFGRLVQALAAVQSAGNVGRLQLSPFGRRMGGKISGDGKQDEPAFGAIPPFPILPHARFEQLIGVELRILAEHRLRERVISRVAVPGRRSTERFHRGRDRP